MSEKERHMMRADSHRFLGGPPTWAARGALLIAIAFGLGSIGSPPAAAAARSTSFQPATATLATGGTATITVSTVGVDATVNGVQLNVQHPSNFTVAAPACT